MKSSGVLFLILFGISCGNVSILDSANNKELYSVKIPSTGYVLRVVFTPSDATGQSSIQIRKQLNNEKEEIVSIYDRYNYMDTCRLINDTTFMIVIRDTISILGNKPDTMLVNFK